MLMNLTLGCPVGFVHNPQARARFLAPCRATEGKSWVLIFSNDSDAQPAYWVELVWTHRLTPAIRKDVPRLPEKLYALYGGMDPVTFRNLTWSDMEQLHERIDRLF